MLKFPQTRVSSKAVDFDISFLLPGGKKEKKKNHSSSSLIFHGNSAISPSLRSGLWFLPDYHTPLPPRWSLALFQLRVIISLLLHPAQDKNSSSPEHWWRMTAVTSEKKKTQPTNQPSKCPLIKRENNESKSYTKLEIGRWSACAFVQKMLMSSALQNEPLGWVQMLLLEMPLWLQCVCLSSSLASALLLSDANGYNRGGKKTQNKPKRNCSAFLQLAITQSELLEWAT